jgi:putative heme-binding domain-containing protein
MFRFLVVVVASLSSLVFAANAFAQRPPKVELVASTEAVSAAEQQKMFHLPPGFEIQLIAAEPDIRKPMNMSFDPQGRLFVTHSIEYPFPATEGTPRDTIRLFTDTNGDGVPDKASTFAEGLNIPIGIMALNGRTVIAYSIPNIERFEDTDGDGRADKRDVLYSKFGFDDTHGMASSFNWWLDGWIYACHGFRNTSTVTGADGQPITMNSGNTYRLRPDGRHIEQFTHGQVNPFGMMFDSRGDVFTADCHSRPIYMLLRGAWYPSFGKPHDGLGYGPEMITHSHGSTGICGVVIYEADNFPAEYRGTAFIGNPVTGRINHDRLAQHGSSYQAVEQPDFLWCEDPWFRPVDIKLAPDGSLYIADFYNCIIGHYEVDLYHPRRDRERGRIWRVVYTGKNGKPHQMPGDLTRQDTTALISRLADPNIVVRTQATHELVERIGPAARDALVATLAKPANEFQQTHAAWALERLVPLTDAQLDTLARDKQAVVRLTAARIVSRRSSDAAQADRYAELISRLLADADPFVRRAAAEAAAQHAAGSLVGPLLSAWSAAAADDTHLVHTIRMALRNHILELTGPEYLARLKTLFRAGDETAQRLAGVALGARTAGSAGLLMDYLQGADLAARLTPEFVHHVARYSDADRLPQVYALVLSVRNGLPDGRQTPLLRSSHQAAQERGAALPAEFAAWADELAGRLYRGRNEWTRRSALELTREFRLQQNIEPASRVANSSAEPIALRQLALEVIAGLDAAKAVPLLGVFVTDAAIPVANRQRGIEILSGLNSPEARAELSRLWGTVPGAVALAAARSLSANRDGMLVLLAAVEQGKTSAGLLQDIVVAARLRSLASPELEERRNKLIADLPDENEQTRQLIAARLAGFGQGQHNSARGAEVFAKTCAACHRLEGKGTKVGPDLDGIGQRGIDRLLEDVLAPNRNVDAAFRSTLVALRDGKTASGLLLNDEGEVVTIVNDQGKEVRIPKSEIEERRLVNLSPMPANIAEQLPEADFHSLMAFLLAQKQAK